MILSLIRFLIINWLIYFWLCWVFVAVHGLSLAVVGEGSCSDNYSLLHSAGFSWWWPLLLWTTDSRVHRLSSCGSWALGHRLSSCGTWGLIALWLVDSFWTRDQTCRYILNHWTIRGVNLIRFFSHRFIDDSYLKHLLLWYLHIYLLEIYCNEEISLYSFTEFVYAPMNSWILILLHGYNPFLSFCCCCSWSSCLRSDHWEPFPVGYYVLLTYLKLFLFEKKSMLKIFTQIL